MSTFLLSRLLSASWIALLLTGCGGVRQSQGEVPPIGTSGATQRSSPAAASGNLLYATSTDHAHLYVMTYPKVKLTYTIDGFSPAALRGICSDADGNVYVTDLGSLPSHTQSHVYVYAHGATTPSRVLSAPPGITNCAVDQGSGDLAVITEENVPSLAIYHNASGSPTLYNGGNYTHCTYDDDGDLYLAAPVFDGGFPLTVFADGKFTNVTLDQRLPFAADVQWNNGMLVFTTKARGKQQIVYWIKFSSATVGHVEQAFTLKRRRNALPRFGVPDVVVGNTVVATGIHRGQLDFWNYPRGGEPKRAVTEPIEAYFFGLAISPGG